VDQSVLLGKGGSDLIKSAHDKQLKVNCWTVNDIADRNALIKLGVDQISGNVLW
jgi:glycerophosphoryl diester phosphodiesterase